MYDSQTVVYREATVIICLWLGLIRFYVDWVNHNVSYFVILGRHFCNIDGRYEKCISASGEYTCVASSDEYFCTYFQSKEAHCSSIRLWVRLYLSSILFIQTEKRNGDILCDLR